MKKDKRKLCDNLDDHKRKLMKESDKTRNKKMGDKLDDDKREQVSRLNIKVVTFFFFALVINIFQFPFFIVTKVIKDFFFLFCHFLSPVLFCHQGYHAIFSLLFSYFFNNSFSCVSRLSTFFFFLLLSTLFNSPFSLSSTLSHISFFIISSLSFVCSLLSLSSLLCDFPFPFFHISLRIPFVPFEYQGLSCFSFFILLLTFFNSPFSS